MQEIFRSVLRLDNGRIVLTDKPEGERFETVAYKKTRLVLQ